MGGRQREAKAIIAPLELVDLDHPKRNMENAYQEMVPMLERIENQRQELKRQMRVLADNDRMRREFTANITHELKTPLTAISGYAELIGSGMVASEDDQRDFAMRIYKERDVSPRWLTISSPCLIWTRPSIVPMPPLRACWHSRAVDLPAC